MTSYYSNNQPEPVNALLIGGEGNDDLEYFASGQAVPVGNGGNNILIGGSKSTIDAFGDTIDPSQPIPSSAPRPGSLSFRPRS